MLGVATKQSRQKSDPHRVTGQKSSREREMYSHVARSNAQRKY